MQNSRFRQMAVVCGLSALIPLLSGCSGSNDANVRAKILGRKAAGGLIPVSGTLLIDGQPQPDVWVRLFKKGDRRVLPSTPRVRTDASGRYVFSTNIEGDGVEPGSYVLMIEWLTKVGSASWGAPDKLLNNFCDPLRNQNDPRFIVEVKGDDEIKIPTIEIATAGLQEMDPRPGGITKMGKPVRR